MPTVKSALTNKGISGGGTSGVGPSGSAPRGATPQAPATSRVSTAIPSAPQAQAVSFGAVNAATARTGAQVQQQMQNFQGVLQRAEDEQDAIESSARIRDAKNQFDSFSNNALRGEGGYLLQQGTNAGGEAYKTVKSAMDKERTRIADTLSAEDREAYLRSSQSQYQRNSQTAATHRAREGRVTEMDTLSASAVTSGQNIIDARNDSQAVDKYIADGVLAIDNFDQLNGTPAEQSAINKRKFVSDSLSQAVGAEIDANGAAAAQALMDAQGARITTQTKVKLQKSIERQQKIELRENRKIYADSASNSLIDDTSFSSDSGKLDEEDYNQTADQAEKVFIAGQLAAVERGLITPAEQKAALKNYRDQNDLKRQEAKFDEVLQNEGPEKAAKYIEKVTKTRPKGMSREAHDATLRTLGGRLRQAVAFDVAKVKQLNKRLDNYEKAKGRGVEPVNGPQLAADVQDNPAMMLRMAAIDQNAVADSAFTSAKPSDQVLIIDQLKDSQTSLAASDQLKRFNRIHSDAKRAINIDAYSYGTDVYADSLASNGERIGERIDMDFTGVNNSPQSVLTLAAKFDQARGLSGLIGETVWPFSERENTEVVNVLLGDDVDAKKELLQLISVAGGDDAYATFNELSKKGGAAYTLIGNLYADGAERTADAMMQGMELLKADPKRRPKASFWNDAIVERFGTAFSQKPSDETMLKDGLEQGYVAKMVQKGLDPAGEVNEDVLDEIINEVIPGGMLDMETSDDIGYKTPSPGAGIDAGDVEDRIEDITIEEIRSRGGMSGVAEEDWVEVFKSARLISATRGTYVLLNPNGVSFVVAQDGSDFIWEY